MALINKIQWKQVGCMAHLFFILTIAAFSNTTGRDGSGNADKIPPALLQAYSSLIDLNIQKVREQLNTFKSTGGHHPFEWYIASMSKTAWLLAAGEKEDYLSNRELEDKYLELARQLDDHDPYKLYLISEIKMQWALVKLKFGDEIAAFWNLRQVYFTSRKALVQFPGFLPLYKTHGFLQALFSGTPKKYQWIIKLFGINPDMEKALQLLDYSNNESNPVYPESLLLTALIHTYYYNDFKEALPVCKQLLENHPESALIRLVYASILVKNSNDTEAFKILSGMEANQAGYLPVPQWHYLLGEIYLHGGHYQKSIEEYRQFLEIQKGKDLVKDAHYKIAMCYWLAGNVAMSRGELDKAAVSGETRTEMDNYANYMIHSKKLPDRQLLKARYYTDGGYFQQADSILRQIEPSQFNRYPNLVEFYYRKARLYHKTGKIPEAVEYYKKTIELQGKENLYFAPNSCLQMGYLYLKNNPEKACFYLRKVFSYKFDMYQQSIYEKARLALKKIKKYCTVNEL